TPGGIPFQDFRVSQYWKIASEESQVLMRFAGTGHAALVERSFGSTSDGDDVNPGGTDEATLLVLTTPIPDLATRRPWNELFSGTEPWPAFLLVRDLARYLTGRAAGRYILPVGSIATLPIRTDVTVPVINGEDSDDRDRINRWQWFPPVGNSAIPIDLNGESASLSATRRLLIGQVNHSGVHWVRGGPRGLGFTANLDRSLLTTGTSDEVAFLDRWQEQLDVATIDSVTEMEWTGAEEVPSVSIWSPVMLIAMIAFLLEQLLGNRFYGGTETKAAKATSQRAAA
ncbi:MAG: hypothetical protein AAGJ83_00515, partial [Planctomycetota bacterium]